MSLCVREQRSLRKIEAALRGSAPHLESLLAVFNRLGRGEEMPRRERLPAGRSRLAAGLMLSLVLAAGLLFLLTIGLGNGGRACLPHPVLVASWRGVSVSMICSGLGGRAGISRTPARRPGRAAQDRAAAGGRGALDAAGSEPAKGGVTAAGHVDELPPHCSFA
jgi:hypothetical protein